MARPLSVWLYGVEVAIVERDSRQRLRLAYTHEALETFDLGTPLLSMRLPLTATRYPNGPTHVFLDGLLPEGEPRRVLAEDLGVASDDTFGLIGALGRDCAGALTIQPYDEPEPPRAVPAWAAEPLTPEDLTRLVANLRSAPLGFDRRVRVSLAGMQEKLLLTRRPDGAWARPTGGTPSTHILKPEIRRFTETVENEAFCMRVAKHLGLSVADVEILTTTGGQRLLAVSRYDRRYAADGTIERVHQEDFCQATGATPRQKYQEDGGPSLRRIAGILRAVDPASLPHLLHAVTLTAIVGNGDAHAKNLSLLHERSGALRLAPLYDVLCTPVFGDQRLAMDIAGARRIDEVTRTDIVEEAASWGMPRTTAHRTVEELVRRAPEAMSCARRETPEVPAGVVAAVEDQVGRLGW